MLGMLPRQGAASHITGSHFGLSGSLSFVPAHPREIKNGTFCSQPLQKAPRPTAAESADRQERAWGLSDADFCLATTREPPASLQRVYWYSLRTGCDGYSTILGQVTRFLEKHLCKKFGENTAVARGWVAFSPPRTEYEKRRPRFNPWLRVEAAIANLFYAVLPRGGLADGIDAVNTF